MCTFSGKDSFVQAHPPRTHPPLQNPGESKETSAVHKNQEQERRSFKKKSLSCCWDNLLCCDGVLYFDIIRLTQTNRTLLPLPGTSCCFTIRHQSRATVPPKNNSYDPAALWVENATDSQRRVTMMQWVIDIRRHDFVSDLVHLHV